MVCSCFVKHPVVFVLLALWAFWLNNIWHISELRSCSLSASSSSSSSSSASTQEEESRRGYLWYQSHRKQANKKQSVVPQNILGFTLQKSGRPYHFRVKAVCSVFICISSFQSLWSSCKVQSSSWLLRVKLITRMISELWAGGKKKTGIYARTESAAMVSRQ